MQPFDTVFTEAERSIIIDFNNEYQFNFSLKIINNNEFNCI
jgi:hypothetical protein